MDFLARSIMAFIPAFQLLEEYIAYQKLENARIYWAPKNE